MKAIKAIAIIIIIAALSITAFVLFQKLNAKKEAIANIQDIIEADLYRASDNKVYLVIASNRNEFSSNQYNYELNSKNSEDLAKDIYEIVNNNYEVSIKSQIRANNIIGTKVIAERNISSEILNAIA